MPKISVLIPAYLRPDDLKVCLTHTLKQNYADVEIIVIDDGTPGDSIRQAVQAFPIVRYVRAPENLGLIGARNLGAKYCEGELILNLDDDSWLQDEDGLAQIVAFMESHPQVGVAALNVELAQIGFCWPVDSPSRPLRCYVGCGNVYRRDVIAQVGDYVEEFRRQGEELERSLRIMDAGYSITSTPWIKIFHAVSPINRNPGKHLAFEAVNYMRRELLRAPTILLPLGIFRALRFAIRHRRAMDFSVYREELLGQRAPIMGLLRKYRKPVRIPTYLTWLRLG